MAQYGGGGRPSHSVGKNEEALINYCISQKLDPPVWQDRSDRRGGRTAWSCSVTVDGVEIEARYWYDGQHSHNAREDAAERALQRLGQLPTPPGPQPIHYQQQQQHQLQQQQQQQQQRQSQQGSSTQQYRNQQQSRR